MIKLESESKISQVEIQKPGKNIQDTEQKQTNKQNLPPSTFRPEVVDAKVYKLKSAFVKNSVFITLSYIKSADKIRPIEIFINSKDLTRAPEYVVLTRLISAIFRRATNPMFILEELQCIFDPNGGSFKEGKYYHSFYAEIAETIERFFFDVGIITKTDEFINNNNTASNDKFTSETLNSEFRLCPDCSHKSLKTENGCDSCIECGYSKCDK
tara:strand:+ start:204 stop:839 length:636 start_codon:yes stop_codon:yes gene_type:complete